MNELQVSVKRFFVSKRALPRFARALAPARWPDELEKPDPGFSRWMYTCSLRRLTLTAILFVFLGSIAASQVSHKDLAIDQIRRMIRVAAGLPWITYGDLDRDIVSLQRLMDSKEFDAAGLNKLSPGEIRSLDRWISEFAFALLRPRQGDCSPAIESTIDGEFNGWSGDTIFKLTNGQIWQQASYDYEYEYEYRPDVIIFSSSGGCKMLVERMDEAIEVKQLR